jgi:hypothetical protein
MIAAGCSSSEPLTIDIARPDAPTPAPVVISGTAVDEGVVCAAGTVNDYRQRRVEGNDAQMVNYFEVVCDDGSGSITIGELLDFEEFPPATFEGAWTLEGSGDYESLTGSGQFSVDDEGKIHDVGEVEA